MFWTLLLCHLIADYPLQTDAMVQAKKHVLGLTAHVGVHLATMLVIVPIVAGAAWATTLLGVVSVTLCHFSIDFWKNILSQRKPQWVIIGYLQDQVLHVASLLLVASWFAGQIFAVPAPWVVYLSGYLLVTHVWFVTEQVLSYRNKPCQQIGYEQRWPRMVSRALLLTLLVVVWYQVGPGFSKLTLLFTWPYQSRTYRQRFVLIDIGVTVAVMLFMVAVLAFS